MDPIATPTRRGVLLIALACILGGCLGSVTRTAPGGDSPSTVAPVPAGDVAPAQGTPAPSARRTGTYQVGDVVNVSDLGEPMAEITVDRVTSRNRYGTGYYADRPRAGHVFLAAEVTYRGLAEEVPYGECDWEALTAGQGVDLVSVLKGPSPTLASGWLHRGDTVTGWLVFEVPRKGRVLLTYRGSGFGEGGEPLFTVILRAR